MEIPSSYLRHHGGDGQPVVLVGELLSGGTSWSAHAKRLSGGWRVDVITPLLASYAAQGNTAPSDWSIATETQALAQVLSDTGIRDAHLAGWSMGGTIALDFALTLPERVRSLTLVEPQVRWLLRQRRLLISQEAAEAEQLRGYAQGPITEARLADFLHLGRVVPLDQDPRASRVWRLAWAHRAAVASAWRVAAHEDDLVRLRGLRPPLLLVRGSDAGALDEAMVHAMAQEVPGARTVMLPGGHNSHLTAADRFLAEMGTFLTEHESKA
jgi:pimeloyl-ACP methyl ester carboxylesterase